MKKYRLMILASAALSLLSFGAGAQNLETAHFLDNYLFGYRLNPSVTPYRTSGFFMLGTGNIGLSTDMNVGLSNFLFHKDGKLVFGLNEAVTYDEFIGPMPEVMNVGVNLSENILSYGRTTKKGKYKTFEINFVTQDYITAPKELFRALKPQPGVISLETITAKDIALRTSNYVEVAFGRAQRVLPFMGIGYRLKGVIGLANMEMNISSMSFKPNVLTGKLDVTGTGTFTAAANPVNFATSGGEYVFTQPQRGGLMPAGLGFGVDLGATFYLWQDRIQLGIAAQDLGFISWTKDKLGTMNYSASYAPDELKGKDAVNKLLRFKKEESDKSKFKTSMPTHFNASVKFKPIQLITLGAVADYAKYNGYSNFGMRFGVALTPFRQLNVAASYGTSGLGQNIGLAASVRLFGISLHAGIDAFMSKTSEGFKAVKVSPQFIPITPLTTTMNVGLAVAFGQSKERAAEISKSKAKSKKAKADENEESLEELEELESEELTEEKPVSKAQARREAKKKARAEKEQKDAETLEAAAQATEAALQESENAVKEAEAAAQAAREQAAAEEAARIKAEQEAKAAEAEAARIKAEEEAKKLAEEQAEAAQAEAEMIAAQQAAEAEAEAAAQKAIEEAKAAQEKAAAEAEAAAKAAIAAAEAEAKAAEEAAAKAAAEAKAAVNPDTTAAPAATPAEPSAE